MNYEISGQMTENEYSKASRIILLRPRRLVLMFLGILLGISGVSFLTGLKTSNVMFVLMFTVGLLLFNYLIYIPFKMRKTFRKTKKINGVKRWIITNEKFEIISDDSSIKYQWDEIKNLIKTKDLILFGLKSPKGFYQMLPTRILFEKKEEIIKAIEMRIQENA